MFLTVDNKIKWTRIAIAALVTLLLVICGVVWFDKPVYLFLRMFDCNLFKWIGYVFKGEFWICFCASFLGVFYLTKELKTNENSLKLIKQFKFLSFLRDFIEKTKHSYVFFIFCSTLSAGIVAKVLKMLIGRARPIFFEALDMVGFFPPSTEWAFNSMPSGHTTVSFAGLIMIGLLVPRFKWLTWTLAILIGVSRVCVGAHWPTDVILGAFIGMVVADIVCWMLRRDK